jgi:hypothetical protein
MLFRIAISTVSLAFSAFVSWHCFAWYRRFHRIAFVVYGVVTALACAFSLLIAFVAMFRLDSAAMERQIAAWQQSDQPRDRLELRVQAVWNSTIISGVVGSLLLTVLPGFYATARFGSEASKQRTLSEG